MQYQLEILERQVYGKDKFVNAAGHTECVAFVQQATGAVQAFRWTKGLHVIDAPPRKHQERNCHCHV